MLRRLVDKFNVKLSQDSPSDLCISFNDDVTRQMNERKQSLYIHLGKSSLPRVETWLTIVDMRNACLWIDFARWIRFLVAVAVVFPNGLKKNSRKKKSRLRMLMTTIYRSDASSDTWTIRGYEHPCRLVIYSWWYRTVTITRSSVLSFEDFSSRCTTCPCRPYAWSSISSIFRSWYRLTLHDASQCSVRWVRVVFVPSFSVLRRVPRSYTFRRKVRSIAVSTHGRYFSQDFALPLNNGMWSCPPK